MGRRVALARQLAKAWLVSPYRHLKSGLWMLRKSCPPGNARSVGSSLVGIVPTLFAVQPQPIYARIVCAVLLTCNGKNSENLCCH